MEEHVIDIQESDKVIKREDIPVPGQPRLVLRHDGRIQAALLPRQWLKNISQKHYKSTPFAAVLRMEIGSGRRISLN